MIKTLYAKLALALFVLLCVMALVLFYIMRFATDMYQQEVSQKLNAAVAAHVVAEEDLFSGSQVNQNFLENLFHWLMVVNPSIELYLLNPDGKVLAYSAPTGKVKLDYVNLAPVKSFIAGNDNYPLRGDDPRHPHRNKVFSAARIPEQGPLKGYLYIVLGGDEYESVAHMLQDSYILRVVFWGLLLCIGLALVAGLVVFALLTRRLRLLDTIMEAFGHSEDQSKARYPKVMPNDEIDRLGLQFNQMAERIEDQVEQLKRMDRMRRDLIANVSHDLRTPLASLHGYLETLLMKADSLSADERHQYLETAKAQSARLAKLTDDLFELAKLDSASDVLYTEPFSLAELLHDVGQKFVLQAQNKGVQLKFDVDQKGPSVYGDIGLMERVLNNLIDNAIRYTPSGGQITLGLVPEGDKVKVKVSDTGCGMQTEELEKIFDRFHRVEKSRKDEEGHAGLGLAIAKRILELHGTQINVESMVNAGTTFSFDMPVHQS